MEDNTYVSCSTHIINKKGVQHLLIKPEQEEPLGRLWRIMKISMFERNMVGGFDCFC